MSTPTITISRVAEATSLPRVEIYRAQELAGLGAPGHFGYRQGEQVFTLEGAGLLAEGLDELGRRVEAVALRAVVSQVRSGASSRGRGWLSAWQSGAEGAA